MLTIIALGVAVVIGIIIGKMTNPKPTPPEPKRFGLDEAEAVSAKIGGLTPATGKIVQLSAFVAGMQFTVTEDARDQAARMTNSAAYNRDKAENYRALATQHDEAGASATARANEVKNLAANFA